MESAGISTGFLRFFLSSDCYKKDDLHILQKRVK